MKVLLLSDAYSEHTEKWALGLAGQGIQIGLFSFNKADYPWYEHHNITVFFEPEERINAERFLTKLSYIKYVSIVKKIVRHFKPDILHAHYATSYGLVGALSGFHPFILSVWGSDVYNFPGKSKFHKRIFQYNLRKADMLMSTSHVMRAELKKYTTKDISVTPFGVNVDEFSPVERRNVNGIVNVGTIKPIEEKYGISDIIDAAALLVNNNSGIRYHFYLIGPGSDLDHYRKVIEEKQLTSFFDVTGRIPFSDIGKYHQLLDIFLNVSVEDSESFGVAAVEAMACGKPVIVSAVGGLLEVIDNGASGMVVPKHDPEKLAAAIHHLATHPEEAGELGKKARERVLQNYNWQSNLQRMVTCYNSFMPAPEV
jgi:L-malate glycosyltransferase